MIHATSRVAPSLPHAPRNLSTSSPLLLHPLPSLSLPVSFSLFSFLSFSFYFPDPFSLILSFSLSPALLSPLASLYNFSVPLPFHSTPIYYLHFFLISPLPSHYVSPSRPVILLLSLHLPFVCFLFLFVFLFFCHFSLPLLFVILIYPLLHLFFLLVIFPSLLFYFCLFTSILFFLSFFLCFCFPFFLLFSFFPCVMPISHPFPFLSFLYSITFPSNFFVSFPLAFLIFIPSISSFPFQLFHFNLPSHFPSSSLFVLSHHIL